MNDTPEQPTEQTADPASGAARGLSLEEILRGRVGEIVLSKPGEELVRISAYTARQKVTGYVAMEISHMMGGDAPALVWSGEMLVWRVPIRLTSPRQGVLGYVGVIDVDAHTGRLLISPDLHAEVERHAAALAAHTPSPATI